MERIAWKHMQNREPVGICCLTQGAQTGPSDNLAGWVGREVGGEVQKGRDICIPMADPCWCMAKTNTTL